MPGSSEPGIFLLLRQLFLCYFSWVGRMRLSEFWIAVADEFGESYGRMLAQDLVLGELGDLTARQAIAQGVATREIWLALCRAADVPESRWYGAGQIRKV
jgi:DUF3046 family protein